MYSTCLPLLQTLLSPTALVLLVCLVLPPMVSCPKSIRLLLRPWHGHFQSGGHFYLSVHLGHCPTCRTFVSSGCLGPTWGQVLLHWRVSRADRMDRCLFIRNHLVVTGRKLSILFFLILIVVAQYYVQTTVSHLEFWLLKFPFAVHAGWILAASFVNLNVLIVDLELGVDAQYYAALSSLIAVLLIASLVLACPTRPELVIPLVLAWATVRMLGEHEYSRVTSCS